MQANASEKIARTRASWGGGIFSRLSPALMLGMAVGARADTIAYYRFETGPAGAGVSSIIDSSGNNNNGTIINGTPTYNSGVPFFQIPLTGQANNFSAYFGPSDAAQFGYPFPFQVFPNATLELWLNPFAFVSEEDFIWTTIGGGDQNRFNIRASYITSGVCLDYREPGGTIHGLGCSGPGTIQVNGRNFVAFVKQGNVYSIYVNGPGTGNITTLTSQVTDNSPNLPNSPGWTINGRGIYNPPDTCGSTCQFIGVLDEIRLSNTALSPAQFLVSLPSTIPFAAFSGKLEIGQNSFEHKASFTLGNTSNGIKPPSEPVTLTVGTYTVTIPAGSFRGRGAGPFTFQGVINGVSLQLRINLSNSQTRQYSLQAEASGARLAGTPDPAPVTLAIGDDGGTTSIPY